MIRGGVVPSLALLADFSDQPTIRFAAIFCLSSDDNFRAVTEQAEDFGHVFVSHTDAAS